MKKKNYYIIFSIALIFIVTLVAIYSAYTFSFSNTSYIEDLLSSEAYSYLPIEAKNYVQHVYDTTGTILLTEKNKIEGLSYLNPDYVNYFRLTDAEKNQLEVIPDELVYDFVYDANANVNNLPDTYDLRNLDGKSYVTPVKNQGSLGLCWAFSGISSIESNLLKSGLVSTNNQMIFNERAIDYVRAKAIDIPYNSNQEQQIYSNGNNPLFPDGFGHIGGGNHVTKTYQYAMYGYGLQPITAGTQWSSYFTNHPTLNIEDVFNFKQYAVTDYKKYSKLVYSIEENSDTQQSFDNILKHHIIANGALSVASASPSDNACVVSYTENNINYRIINRNSVCAKAANKPNYTHAMSIVGWDDNFEQYYCTSTTDNNVIINTITNNGNCNEGDVLHHIKGVWIVKNSWGPNHGNQGYAYLAYQSREDSFYGVTKTIETDFNNFYSSSSPFENATINNESNNNYIVNFEKNNHYEKLKRITIELKNIPSNHTMEVFINDKSNHYVSLGTINIDYLGVYSIDVNDYSLDTRNFTLKIENSESNLSNIIENIMAYTEDTNNDLIPATSISLNPTSKTLYKNGNQDEKQIQLNYELNPSNSTDTVIWTSDNPNIATVSNGLVTAKNQGITTITATTSNGKTATCTITVIVPVNSVTIQNCPANPIHLDDNTLTLTAEVLPSDATNKNVTWSSNSPSVVEIDPTTGKITTKSTGSAVITATADGKSGNCNITVDDPLREVNINTSNGTTVEVNNTLTLIAEITPSSPTNFNSEGISWSSSNPNTATVEKNGSIPLRAVVTGKNPGPVDITLTVTTKDNQIFTKTISIQVNESTQPTPITTVTLSPKTMTLRVNDTGTITATVSPENTIIWSSSKPLVATVDGNGNITARSVGETIITARTPDGKYSDSATITVISNLVPATGITLNKSETTTTVGGTEILKATLEPENAETNITWSSKDESIVRVNQSGKITGVKAGTTTITAKAKSGVEAKCSVTVMPQVINVESISLDKEELHLRTGETGTLTVTFNPSNATNQNIEWTSSNQNIATVNNGKVKALKKGEAIITAKSLDGKKTASAKIYVTQKDVAVTNVEISPTEAELEVGGTLKFSAKITPNEATDKRVTWTSSNRSVATIDDNGVLTAKGEGTTTITVTTSSGNKVASTTVRVIPNTQTSSDITISLNHKTLSIIKGKKIEINATVEGSNEKVVWASSDETIAKVENGVVTGINKGKVTITASLEGTNIKETCEVEVILENEQGIKFASEEFNIYLGETNEIEIITMPTDLKIDKIEWKIQDEEIVSITDGKIKGLTLGSTQITVKVNNKYEAQTIINVILEPLSINITGYDLNFNENTYNYTLKIKKEKALEIVSNRDVEIVGNENLKNKSIIKIIDTLNDKEYQIKIIKKNTLIYYFASIIVVLLALNIYRFIKKKRSE